MRDECRTRRPDGCSPGFRCSPPDGRRRSLPPTNRDLATWCPWRHPGPAHVLPAGYPCNGFVQRAYSCGIPFVNANGGCDVQSQLVTPEGCTKLHALHHGLNALHHFASDCDTGLAGFLRVVGPAHPLHEAFRHRYAQFVYHELRVAITCQWPNATNHGDPEALNAAEELLQQAQVEHRLSDHVFGARFHLTLKAMDLFVQIYGAGI